MEEFASNIHTGYSTAEERKLNTKKDAFLFDCICDYFKSHFRRNRHE